MKVVLLHELRAAIREHVRVNTSARQLSANVVGAPLSLGERSRCSRTVTTAIFRNLEA